MKAIKSCCSKLLLIIALFFLCGFSYSQGSDNSFSTNSSLSSMQILLPKNPYVGDECELKYIFQTDADLFNDGIAGQKLSTLKLSPNWPVFRELEESCLVQNVVLEHSGFEYTLTIKFIPWKSGDIDFKVFDLAALVNSSKNQKSVGAPYSIDIAPFYVNSLAKKMGVTSIRPSKSPMVIPGTSFILIILALVFFTVAGLVFYFFIKLPFIFSYFIFAMEKRKIKKLFKKTEKCFIKLLKCKNDEFFCQSIYEEIKNYLCLRFDNSFSVITSSSLSQKFQDFFCGTLSEKQEDAVFELTEILHRCDYIRFAKGSIDSFRKPPAIYETVLAEGERKLLVNRALTAISVFNVEQN